MKKLLILIAVLVVGLGINACNAHGLYWDWDASYDPTTVDTNEDGEYDWVERNQQAFSGGLITDDGRDVWRPVVGWQILDTRPLDDFGPEAQFAEVVWKSRGSNEVWDATFWMYVEISESGGMGTFQIGRAHV